MALNDIVFQKQNGGMGLTAPSDDPVSGLLLGLNGSIESNSDMLAAFDTITVSGVTLYVAALKYFEQLEASYAVAHKDIPDGETLSDEEKAKNFIEYHVRNFFGISQTGTLFLALKLTGEILPAEIAALQVYASGRLRQVGVAAAGETSVTADQIAAYQAKAVELEADHMPLSVLVALRKGAYTDLADIAEEDFVMGGRSNVSVFISQDLDATLIAEQDTNGLNELAAIGILLGCVSAASVNESIAWVQKFPLSMKLPGFITGELLKETATVTLNLLNDARFLFVRNHVGAAYCYFNDSHTLDVATSDYAYIENSRTMDKATRGIRTNLLPYLNAPLKVDPDSGTLSQDTVALLETVAGRALEDMEKADELSGYSVQIDPDQNVLATSELEIVIRNVPVGVMRKVRIKIGYTTKLS